jgi:hypothetical protein
MTHVEITERNKELTNCGPDEDVCRVERNGWYCTRVMGHDGRHVARIDSVTAYADWEEDGELKEITSA